MISNQIFKVRKDNFDLFHAAISKNSVGNKLFDNAESKIAISDKNRIACSTI